MTGHIESFSCLILDDDVRHTRFDEHDVVSVRHWLAKGNSLIGSRELYRASANLRHLLIGGRISKRLRHGGKMPAVFRSAMSVASTFSVSVGVAVETSKVRRTDELVTV